MGQRSQIENTAHLHGDSAWRLRQRGVVLSVFPGHNYQRLVNTVFADAVCECVLLAWTHPSHPHGSPRRLVAVLFPSSREETTQKDGVAGSESLASE